MWAWLIRSPVGPGKHTAVRAVQSLPRTLRDKCSSDALKNPKPRDPFASHTKPGKQAIYAFMSIFIGIPIIAAGTASLFLFKEESKREPFVPYSYLRIRHKRFPWGDGQRSFFHNPKFNALPDGYETEEEEEK